ALTAVPVTEVVADLDRYIRPRLPRLASRADVRMREQDATLTVRGDRVLRGWAPEDLLKNALDALAGRGRRLRVAARRAAQGRRRGAQRGGGGARRAGVGPALRGGYGARHSRGAARPDRRARGDERGRRVGCGPCAGAADDRERPRRPDRGVAAPPRDGHRLR